MATTADHRNDLREFWQRLQSGVAVAVAAPNPDKLLGVRDGFVRYFSEGLGREVPVAVVPQPGGEEPIGLAASDLEVLAYARREVADLERRLGGEYHFYLASEGGLQPLEIDRRQHWFVRNWTVIRSPIGEAWGGSGAVELPERLIAGLGEDQVPFAVPGTRKGGGITASLTGGLENRRRATALSTTHALATLFYGLLEGRVGRGRS
jgi:non-canonical (house-cleaning) NTP pyrophosphatase